MHKDLEIWRFGAERLRRGESVTLLVVAESSGSSPGRRGFKMAVANDDMTGSVGGGVMEVNLVGQAREVLISGQWPVPGSRKNEPVDTSNSFIKQQDHQKNSANPSGMICSGKQTVVFLKLAPSHLKTIAEIIGALEKNEPKVLRITPDKIEVQEPPEGGTQNNTWTPDGDNFIYEEKLGYKNKLFIIGGGHCALALSELMSKMDFYIALFDDRPDLNTLDKNNFVHEKNIIGSYGDIAGFIPAGEKNFVVVMTLGYKSDEIVIRKLFDKEFRYFGVLGSRAKMKTLLRDLEKEGFSNQKLSSLHTPIGLPINSQTPEEIAISIAAEIIAVKNSAK